MDLEEGSVTVPIYATPQPGPSARPTVVTAASILLYAVAGAQALMGVALLVTLGSVREAFQNTLGSSDLDSEMGAVVTATMVTIAVVYLFIAIGLVVLATFNGMGKNPSRIVTWVFAGIGLCCNVLSLFDSVPSMVTSSAGSSGTGSDQFERQFEAEIALGMPGWFVPVMAVLALVTVAGLIAVIIMLALPASNAYFRKAAVWNPGYPGYAGQPGYPGQPGHPGQPGYSGQPGHPGQSGYPGQPGYSGQPGYPGQPGYSGQPGYPGQAGQPPAYGQPYPGQPGSNTPDSAPPAYPGAPASYPGAPTSGTPGIPPSAPNAGPSAYPGAPGAGHLGAPEQYGQPGQPAPGLPPYPGQAGAHAPGHPETGSSEYPGPPSDPWAAPQADPATPPPATPPPASAPPASAPPASAPPASPPAEGNTGDQHHRPPTDPA
jgi:hypothetical protein